MASLRHVLALTLVVLAAAVAATPAAAGDGFFVGVDEDAVLWRDAHVTASVARAVGLKAIRVTVPWKPGQTQVAAMQQQQLERAIVEAWGMRVVLTVYGRADDAPTTAAARAEFCAYAGDILRRNPSIADVVIWNDPNDGAFWSPQTANGKSVAPAAYGALLAQCWDVLHGVRKSANVVAVAVSKQWASGAGQSHPVAEWYRRVGVAYRASKRNRPLFDTVGHIAHPVTAAERPWTRHTDGHVGVGDYDRLVAALERAFHKTRQPAPGRNSKVKIWYLAQGFQTRADAAKEGLYSGRETDGGPVAAWSAAAASDSREGPAPDQATQLVDAVRVASCQPAVGAFFNFHLADESDLTGWQSGVLWADWTPKPSYSALRDVVAQANAGAVDCATVVSGSPPPVAAPVQATVELKLADVRVTGLSAFSVSVAWRTSAPAAGRLALGLPGSDPTVWSAMTFGATEHRATISGLRHATPYRLWVVAATEDGRRVQTAFDVHTPGLPWAPVPGLDRSLGNMLLDGHPFFPMIVWAQCPDGFNASVSVGINLFSDNPCGTFQQQLNALGGRALSAGVGGKDGGHGAGIVGYFHPDEPDGAGITAASLPPAPPGIGGLRFLTLTNHFYSGAAPLPQGRAMYPGLIAASDVVGFDLYPLQEWCRPERLGDVYDSQHELIKMSPGRATFQWIETTSWRCPSGRTAVTPATVRAESWLAIAGGARGLAFFPADYPPAVGGAIAQINREIAALGPALMARSIGARSDNAKVKVSARAHEGVVYVIAVNAGFEPERANIRVSSLGERTLSVFGTRRTVVAHRSSFPDSFEPLGVHVYVVEPPVGAIDR